MAASFDIPDQRERSAALDPEKSFIVQAPAGSGKTTLLAMRYIELLSYVSAPEEILAITFTKKAANEMKARVLELLNTEGAPTRRARNSDETRNWEILQNPNRLKIQTIDSFANEISNHSFGANNYRGYSISQTPWVLYRLAAERTMHRLYEEDSVSSSLMGFLEFCSNDYERAYRMIIDMLSKRDQWLDITQLVIKESFEPENLVRHFNLIGDLICQRTIENLAQKLTKADEALIRMVEPEIPLTQAIPIIARALITKAGSFRKRLTAKEHVAFSDKDLKSRLSAWIDEISERELLADFVTIQHLPENIELNGIRSITDCCICIAVAATELESVFKEQREIDFTAIAMQAQSSLGDEDSPSELALSLGYRIQHILVDEFQDTSRSQMKFFNQLTESWSHKDGHSFFAVGDPMQSVYSFRDADIRVFNEIKENGLAQLPVDNLSLKANFRSDPKLVDWINSLFSDEKANKENQLLGETKQTPSTPVLPKSEKAKVECYEFELLEHEIASIVKYLLNLKSTEDSIGILCRSRSHLKPLIDAIDGHHIGWQANDIYSLEEEPLTKDLLALYQTLFSTDSRLAWFIILRSPLLGLTLMELEMVAQQSDPWDYIRTNKRHDLRLNRLHDAYIWANTYKYEFSLREVLEGFWVRLGGVDAYGQDGLNIAIAFFDFIEELGELAYDLEQLKESLSNLYSPPKSEDSNIQIMTIHKAKGLEFDHVVVPFLDRRTRVQESPILQWSLEEKGLLVGAKGDPIYSWINYQSKKKSENENERLLYVALTRARRTMFVSYTRKPEASISGLARYLADFSVVKTDQHSESLPKPSSKTISEKNPNNFLKHLPSDYKWKTKSQPLAKSTLPLEYSEETSDEELVTFEMILGQTVHQGLAWLTTNEHPDLKILKSLVRKWSANRYSEKDLINELEQKTDEHLWRTLNSKQGQWILRQREDHKSEYGMTGVINGSIQRVFVDRMFVENKQRWIIDYKTGTPLTNLDPDTFYKAQIELYKNQLERYQYIAKNIYSEPIKTGLFFTATATFKEVTL